MENGAKLSEAEAIPVDRLSSLPESLIFHILSFLPTPKVVAMSILSKRWQYVWNSVDTIDFFNLDRRCEDFRRMVDKVICSHKVECIKKMKLHCCNKGCTQSDVRRWMRCALKRGVQFLVLDFFYLIIKPPRSLFTSKTLAKLEILKADLRSANVPYAPFLPKLKLLRLPLLKYDTQSLKRFITGCPTLEILYLSTGNLVVETLDISSPTLKRLELESYKQYSKKIRLTQSPVYKVDKILLNVPALKFLRVQHPVSVIIIGDKLYSLAEVDISIAVSSHDSYHKSISRFFQLISNVKILRFRTIDRPITSVMPAQFPNLTKLEIVSPYFELILVQFLFEAAMNLEVIIMEKDPDLDYEIDSDEEWEEEEPGESLSDCDKDDEDETLGEGCSRGEEEEESEDVFFVPDGYLSENEGVEVEKMDLDELAEGRNAPTASDALQFEDLILPLKQQKYLCNMTEHALRKNQPLVILNLNHEKASVLLVEDLTGAAKTEKLCLQALSMCAFPDSHPIEISVCNDVVEENQEACSTQRNTNILPVTTEAAMPDSVVPQIIAVIRSNPQGISKIIEALQHKFPNNSKSQLRNKVREIADYCDNRWQVKKDILLKFGLSSSPEIVRGKNQSIATFFSKRCQPPEKHFDPKYSFF